MNDNLSKATVGLLDSAIRVAVILGIERIVIDPHSLRGESKENGTFMLLPFPDGFELEFGSLGVNRVPVLKSRLGLIGDSGAITPDYKERDSGDKFVFRLLLKNGNTKLDFKCADPSQIRAPKAFNDPDYFSFFVTPADIDLMLKAKSVMQSEQVTFSSNDGTSVKFSISAAEGDTLDHVLESGLVTKAVTTNFVSSYKNKILFPILKSIIADSREEPVEIVITKRGILKVEVDGIPAFIFPEV